MWEFQKTMLRNSDIWILKSQLNDIWILKSQLKILDVTGSQDHNINCCSYWIVPWQKRWHTYINDNEISSSIHMEFLPLAGAGKTNPLNWRQINFPSFIKVLSLTLATHSWRRDGPEQVELQRWSPLPQEPSGPDCLATPLLRPHPGPSPLHWAAKWGTRVRGPAQRP